MNILLISAVLLGAVILLDWRRRLDRPLKPGERLARLRQLTEAPQAPARGRRGEPEITPAVSVGDSRHFDKVVRFKIRFDVDRAGGDWTA